jgi:hypothetical protein
MRYRNENAIARAATEQDMGRAFRYKSGSDDLPIILVSPELKVVLSKPAGLLLRTPGSNMKPKHGRKIKIARPITDDDMDNYRKYWMASDKHFDHNGSNYDHERNESAKWVNPRRWALVAEPQVGKTGTYQYLIYLLWKHFQSNESFGIDDLEPHHETSHGNGSNSLLEALQSQGLGHLHSLLLAKGSEIASLDELRFVARELTMPEFLKVMNDVGVTKLAERVKLYKLSSSDDASQPVESSAGAAY